LHVPPESFLRTIRADAAGEDVVLLAPNGAPVYVTLARRVVKGRQAACVFLMQIDDVARCGLGGLRPLPCQSFPATGEAGLLCLPEQHICTCRAWSIADLDRAMVKVQLEREAAERARDRRLIQEWNIQVTNTTRTSYTLADFCDYVIHAYARHADEGTAEGAP
jgi:Fe-S-cluster containining protein